MCVICVKPAGKELPSKDRLRAMFEANSDGVGFMFIRNKKIQIRKGFMKFKSFLKGLEQEEIKTEDLLIMHFRIATTGSVSPQNCHPFPISQKHSDLRATKIETDLAMAHNGILNYEDDTANNLSDTMTFTRDILADPVIRKKITEPAIWTLLEMSIGSGRIVFVENTGKFSLLGDWYLDKEANDGCFYSNLYFKARIYVASKNYQGNHGVYYSHNRGFENKEPLLLPNDLDANAYKNKPEEFAVLQAQDSVLIFPEDKTCPACSAALSSAEQLACYKCGKMFYRSYND